MSYLQPFIMLIVPTLISHILPELFFNIISCVCAHGTSQILYNINLMRMKM